MKRHTRNWKETHANELRKLFDSYEIIGIADLSGFPAGLFQAMRKKLHGKAVIKVVKTKVAKKALGESRLSGKGLENKLEGSLAIIFTKMNPFELFAFLKKNKGSIAAKEGQIAPFDIVVPAGDTGLPPGPALSDLKAAGLNARIQGSTIVIPNDTVVTKKGQAITKPVAGTLSKLDIKPMKVGLNLVCVLEKEEIYSAETLDIDTEKMFRDFGLAYMQAIELAIEAQYFTPLVTEKMIERCQRQANAISAIAGAAQAEKKKGEQEEGKKEEKMEAPNEEEAPKEGQPESMPAEGPQPEVQ